MMTLVLIMTATVYLQVTGPVASLQCDLDTAGTVELMSGITTKQLSTNRLSDGRLRVLVYGLNQATFSGAFATVDKTVQGISGVVTANPDATQSTETVKKVSKPRGLTVIWQSGQ